MTRGQHLTDAPCFRIVDRIGYTVQLFKTHEQATAALTRGQPGFSVAPWSPCSNLVWSDHRLIPAPYLTWEGGISHEHDTAERARAHYWELRRSGVPCSLYLDGDCVAAANGASNITVDRRAALDEEDLES